MKATVYVDGSFSIIKNRGIYGAGIVVFIEGRKEPIFHKIANSDPSIARLRNVAGEIMGVVTAMGILTNFSEVDNIEVCYDYEGLQKWVTGEWTARKPFTAAYAKTMHNIMQEKKITFTKVAAHTGVLYNEEADRLAKEAVQEYARNI